MAAPSPPEGEPPGADGTRRGSAVEVFLVFLRLGLTSFGGPVAHIGYFRDEIVRRRRWLDEAAYAELVALCQFMPGPASSQVGLGIGLLRAGHAGSLAAWTGFTLPSAVVMTLFALGLQGVDDADASGWLHGLKVMAVAVVAHAVLGMAGAFCRGAWQAVLTLAAAAIVLSFPGFTGQLGAIGLGALAGIVFARTADSPAVVSSRPPIGRRAGAASLVAFALLFLTLPVAAASWDSMGLRIVDAFYRTGSLVFGGGHVVLPLLKSVVVEPGWVSEAQFLAGYSAAQAVPGPLFTFAAYLGAAQTAWPHPVTGAALAVGGIFLPSFLLVTGLLPFWQRLRRRPRVSAAMVGVNAAVVGLLLGAFYDPVVTAGIRAPADGALALAGFLLLAVLRWPAWAVVLLGAAGGIVMRLVAS
jgi:chromate transporter